MMLERRFQGIIKRFERARDAPALLALWTDCVARGEIAGALWALMTHPQADARVQSLAFEEVHMLSHQVGAGNRADLKRLADTLAKLSALRRDFDALYARTHRQSEEREALIHDLERILAEREAALAGADAVICATDYISHAAYYRTKRYCKHHAKPHVLVPRSGLAAFALERVAG
jgi:hypothetical protein